MVRPVDHGVSRRVLEHLHQPRVVLIVGGGGPVNVDLILYMHTVHDGALLYVIVIAVDRGPVQSSPFVGVRQFVVVMLPWEIVKCF